LSEGKPASDLLPGKNGIAHNNLPWRHAADTKVFSLAERHSDPLPLVRAAQRLLPVKASWDPHRIKFPLAAWENVGWVSPAWRPHMLAAASYFFLGADSLDSDFEKQVRETVRGR
jgi:hypothetical protein